MPLKPKHRRTPSLFRQAVNLAGALARHVAAGMPTRPVEEQKRCLEICEACPSCFVQQGHLRCEHCGCFLTVKVRWAQESCPLGKW